ncbi:hypothetical protein TNCT_204011 [Trichonephila clavata]|uniref:Uncharacterized protein n=1 Tax=Trichonephila clavata TaxID=2740835 RepID=A0A8X6GA07_TRICU|nr:hypothetical protein TNCT_204011 [Trichonephila clavata]
MQSKPLLHSRSIPQSLTYTLITSFLFNPSQSFLFLFIYLSLSFRLPSTSSPSQLYSNLYTASERERGIDGKESKRKNQRTESNEGFAAPRIRTHLCKSLLVEFGAKGFLVAGVEGDLAMDVNEAGCWLGPTVAPLNSRYLTTFPLQKWRGLKSGI